MKFAAIIEYGDNAEALRAHHPAHRVYLRTFLDSSDRPTSTTSLAPGRKTSAGPSRPRPPIADSRKAGQSGDGGCPQAPQTRSDDEGGAAGLAPQALLCATRSPMGNRKIAGVAHERLFNLIRGPGMIDPGETMLDAVPAAAHVEHIGQETRAQAVGVTRWQLETDTVVGQRSVDPIRHHLDKDDRKADAVTRLAFSTSCNGALL